MAYILTHINNNKNQMPKLFNTEFEAFDNLKHQIAELLWNDRDYEDIITSIIYDDAHNLITDDGDRIIEMIISAIMNIDFSDVVNATKNAVYIGENKHLFQIFDLDDKDTIIDHTDFFG